MQWEKAGCPEHCLACQEEARAAGASPFATAKFFKPLPCDKHGDPRVIDESWWFYLSLYTHLLPYSVLVTYEKKGGNKNVTKTFLNIEVLKIFCDEMEIPFRQTYQKLYTIHEVYNA